LLAPTASAESELVGMDLEDLMEIEVTTVSKQSRKIGESPAAVTVLNQEDIRRSGATSIPELLRMVPGLHVAQIDANHWSVSSRGFSEEFSNKLQVMLDGRSIYTNTFSGVLWNEHDLMLEDIERIEVVRGPGGTLWGANAVNGVINIISKHASETQGLLVSGRAGDIETGAGAARYGYEIAEGAHVRVYGKYADRGNFDSPASGSASDAWETLRTGARLDWDVTDRDSLMISGDFYDVEAQKLLVAGLRDEEENQGANLMLRASHAFSDTSEASLQTYWAYTDRDWLPITEKRNTFDVELQHSFSPLARNQIVWGAGYRLTTEDVDGSIALDFSDTDQDDNLFSFFVQNETALVEGLLSLTLGSKLEHNDYTGFEYQPGGRILLTPGENMSFWGAVSRAVRSPSRADEDLMLTDMPGPTDIRVILGSSEFDSEKLLAYELGGRAQVLDNLSVDLAAYYNDYDQLRTTEVLAVLPDTPFAPLTTSMTQLDNQMEGTAWGIEFASTLTVNEYWRLVGTYTFTELDFDADAASTDVTSEAIAGYTPEHQLGLRSNVNLPWNLELDAAVYWVDDTKGTAGAKVDDYTRLDTRLAWRPREGLEFSLVGLNLVDEHEEFGAGLITQTSRIPRSVYGAVRWDFR
jgi:iron complex outermembrane receptor protein